MFAQQYKNLESNKNKIFLMRYEFKKNKNILKAYKAQLAK